MISSCKSNEHFARRIPIVSKPDHATLQLVLPSQLLPDVTSESGVNDVDEYEDDDDDSDGFTFLERYECLFEVILRARSGGFVWYR